MNNKEKLRSWIYRIMATIEETPDEKIIAELRETGNLTELKILIKQ